MVLGEIANLYKGLARRLTRQPVPEAPRPINPSEILPEAFYESLLPVDRQHVRDYVTFLATIKQRRVDTPILQLSHALKDDTTYFNPFPSDFGKYTKVLTSLLGKHEYAIMALNYTREETGVQAIHLGVSSSAKTSTDERADVAFGLSKLTRAWLSQKGASFELQQDLGGRLSISAKPPEPASGLFFVIQGRLMHALDDELNDLGRQAALPIPFAILLDTRQIPLT